jgi:flagellar basal-body rod protein FlgF
MQHALLIGLSRQVALGRELDVVANNIANLNTSGFKADGSIFEEYLSPTAKADAATQAESKVSFVRDRGTWHNMSQGPIERTGNPLDIAIDGKGFLVVRTPQGERYTRNGALQINGNGNLVTSEGFEVVGDSGPITIQRGDREIAISAQGMVSVRAGTGIEDSQRGKLRIVSFDDSQAMQLKKDGSGTFSIAAGITPQADTKSQIVQGSIEKSNVRGVVEMTRMIEITRSYSQVAALLQQQSEMRTSAISKLADVPA